MIVTGPSPRRGAGPVVAVAGLIVLPALALVGLWRFAAGRDGDGGPEVSIPPTTVAEQAAAVGVPQLPTPLLSLRRVPGLIARELNAGGFAEQVAAFGNTLDSSSCLVVELDGVEVGAHNPDLAVIPASNQKLLTAAAALHVLGPDHTFTTEVRAPDVAGGVVAGDLYLVGGGDPLLRTPDWDGELIGYPLPAEATNLDALAEQIVAAGIGRIDGSVLGDGSRYDDELYHDHWSDDVRVAEAGPLSALLVNDDRLLAGGEWTVANSPNAGAAAELTRMLEARGVTVAGEPGSGAAPGGAELVAQVQSAPLRTVIFEMLSTSDNNTAELLIKELGVATGAAGTTDAGVAVVAQAMGELGIDTSQLVVADGSGLSNDNRVSCRAITQLLRRHVPGDDLAAGLPVAGRSGTLGEAFVDTPMEGVLLGKTGSLGNPPYNADPPSVKALAGYVPVEGGGTIQFALILNNRAANVADMSVNRPVWDAFAEVLGSYPSGPTAAQLGPIRAETAG